jgi:hypothetical protein
MNEYMRQRQEHINKGRPLAEKKKHIIPKLSEKRAKKLEEQKKERGDGDTEKQKWFKNRIKQMSGRCNETGLKTETKIYLYAIRSICHILPQESCKSVQFHPLNWIELNIDFHVKFDAMSWQEREKMGCWPVIMERLIMIYPDLDPLEHRHFPESVLDYINKHEPF